MAEAAFAAEYQEYIDWWLMQKFPGRTLEELDNIDWLRLRRAMEVGRIVDVEAKNALLIEGKLKADAIRPAEWRMIERHNELYDAWESAHGGAVDGE